jgi:hypothetical protein
VTQVEDEDRITAPRAQGRVDSEVGGPVRVAWREGTLTRARELEALARWMEQQLRGADGDRDPARRDGLMGAVASHLKAARQAADRRPRRRNGSRLERAISNLDAAEADLFQLAPPEYLLGQMPSVLNHVQRHLKPTDPRRAEIERIARRLGVNEPEPVSPGEEDRDARGTRRRQVDQERGTIVSAVRGASSAALREQTRVRSFRNVVVLAATGMALVAIALGVVGIVSPTTIPLCFSPEQVNGVTVVCPTEADPVTGGTGGTAPAATIDDVVDRTARSVDVPLVELVGLTAASVAAAAAIRGIRGSSEPYGVPLALAALKLPTGAVTAVLGLLLMRGEFVPGLSALDSSAQILAWAIVFGYAQQVFTRLVDQQAHTVLDGVRGANNAKEPDRPTTPASGASPAS